MSSDEIKAGLPILAFVDRAAFATWCAGQPRDSTGIWLRLAKKDSGIPSVSKTEAIDVALCCGWIDGQSDRYDAESWLIRFTPRRPRSKWSEINVRRAVELIAEGRMTAMGLAEIDAAKSDGRWDAAYAPASTAAIPDDLQAAFDANPQAAAFFATLKGPNRYAVLHRIATVKMAATRARKIAQFVDMLARGETIY